MIASPYRFRNEFRIIGMRRCGQHAIANWIIRQTSDLAWYINDINPNHSIIELGRLYNPLGQWYENGVERAAIETDSIQSLVYNHEDWRVDDIATVNSICEHDTFIGNSINRYDILVLREPANLFASRYYFRSGMPANAQRWKWNDGTLWVNHAREYLDMTCSLASKKVVIAFDRWIRDKDYRGDIASLLGLHFTDTGIDDVWHIGSTFDAKEYDGQASRMDLTGRWKYTVSIPEYLEIFSDGEVLEMSADIFGVSPATRYIKQALGGAS